MTTARPVGEKATLLDQLIFVETEVEDINTWETVYRMEGSELPSGMAYRRRLCQQIGKTLELVKMHEREIVALVKAKRSQKGAAVRLVSTATSSAQSSPSSAESEDLMEPSSEP